MRLAFDAFSINPMKDVQDYIGNISHKVSPTDEISTLRWAKSFAQCVLDRLKRAKAIFLPGKIFFGEQHS